MVKKVFRIRTTMGLIRYNILIRQHNMSGLMVLPIRQGPIHLRVLVEAMTRITPLQTKQRLMSKGIKLH